MDSTGYAGTPLIRKLGIGPNMKILVLNAPSDYDKLINASVRNQMCKTGDIPDLVHVFVSTKKELETVLIRLRVWADKNTAIVIWISWYKKSAKIPTDVTENVIRDLAILYRFVDVKVCAVNEIWSGLKLVVPIKHR